MALDLTDPIGLQLQIQTQIAVDQFSQDVAQIQDPLSGGGGGGGGVVPVTGFASSDGFASVETPTPTTRDIKKGPNVGNLWDKDAAAAITDPPTLTVGGLPVGATYSQAEVTALRDALIALSDKVRDELAKLRAAGIQTT